MDVVKIVSIVLDAATTDNEVKIIKSGKISRFTSLTVGAPYFLGEDGNITKTCPSTEGQIICKLGTAIDNETLLLQIEECIVIA